MNNFKFFVSFKLPGLEVLNSMVDSWELPGEIQLLSPVGKDVYIWKQIWALTLRSLMMSPFFFQNRKLDTALIGKVLGCCPFLYLIFLFNDWFCPFAVEGLKYIFVHKQSRRLSTEKYQTGALKVYVTISWATVEPMQISFNIENFLFRCTTLCFIVKGYMLQSNDRLARD